MKAAARRAPADTGAVPVDLRGFLDAHGDTLLRITKEVALEDIGALTGQSRDTILFEHIRGYSGWRLVDRLFSNRAAQGRVLGCAPGHVVPTLARILDTGPRKFRVVDDGPVKEIKLRGGDADLTKLPVVTHTDVDPGPYMTGFNVVRDPETGLYNSMNPRALILGPRRTLVSFVTRHVQVIFKKYQAAGQKMPQALCIGAHPAFELAATYSGLHDDFWEVEYAGTILGQTLDLVRCETIDLLVPATAELVIEGFVHPERVGTDGPNPGPTTYFLPRTVPAPEFEVTAITMRRNPIYRNHQIVPFTDHQPLPRLFHEAQLYRQLRSMGLDVREVFFPPWGAALSCIIQVAPAFDGQVADALLAVMGAPWLNTKLVVAVDPDINVYDPADVYFALATRVDPARHVVVVPNTRANPMDPSATPVVAAGQAAVESRFPSVVGKMGIDATKPVPYCPNRKDFERGWPINWGKIKLEDFLPPK
ncbi:MAG: UbiD family decarboxylase domain-containing protein [Candidatus Binatia bacterium]